VRRGQLGYRAQCSATAVAAAQPFIRALPVTTKNRPPTAEETAFWDELSKLMGCYGASVSAFSSFDDKTLRDPYGLVFCKGSKRTTLQSDIPFSWTRRQKSLIV
jgi:hypothetical protein